MTLGDVLAPVLERAYELWPLRIVSAWQQGVHMRAGQPRKLLTHENGLRLIPFWGRRTGLHAFIPFLDEIMTADASIEVAKAPAQTCTTADGQSVTFRLTFSYRVIDAVKVYTRIYEYKDTVIDEGCASAGELVATMDADELWGSEDDDGNEVDGLTIAVERDIRKRLEDWGIELESARLRDCVIAKTYRLIGDGAGVATPGTD